MFERLSCTILIIPSEKVIHFLGPGAAERSALVKRANEVWGPLMAGKEYNKELVAEYYTAMCEDIIKQKKRIGGNWAIAHVVFSTEVKNVMRLMIL